MTLLIILGIIYYIIGVCVACYDFYSTGNYLTVGDLCMALFVSPAWIIVLPLILFRDLKIINKTIYKK